ncbi:ABC transporter permease [Paenibacillus glycinis]|uniref:Transport permease protein n=1 Tax=Paenibacillus glycinis TaxID=2697035 RepID=A0ABW9XW24_9BACL|nr:ABC transporter permease [Paenibacillus glycinis]NBD26880.1 ABC transporter permease [Paenibacillus glycinis]
MKTANGLAGLPDMAHTRVRDGGLRRWRTELSILFRIQFAIIRDSWVWVVLMATLLPLAMILFMNFFMENPTPETMVRILAGNLIFGVIVMGLNSMGQEISWQKHQGHFTFYASLPISKLNFVIANMLRGLMSTLPSFIILGAIGQYVLGVEIHYSWGLPVVVLLSMSSVVGAGVALGFWSPSHQLTNVLAQSLMMVVSFLSPVMVEMSSLPPFVQWISYLLPTTYAADAMRAMLLGGWNTGVLADCLIMLGFTAASVVLINRLVNWRVKA